MIKKRKVTEEKRRRQLEELRNEDREGTVEEIGSMEEGKEGEGGQVNRNIGMVEEVRKRKIAQSKK